MRFTIVVPLVLLGVCAVYSVPLEKSKLKKSLLQKLSGSSSTKQLLKKDLFECDAALLDLCDGVEDCWDGSDEEDCDLLDEIFGGDDDDMFKKRALKRLLDQKKKK